MARKDYPYSRRTNKQMNNLTSGLLTGLLLAPIAVIGALAKSSGNKEPYKKNEKNEKSEALWLLVTVLFLTPLYIVFAYFGFQYELFFFPIIGELLFIGSTFLFFGGWWVAISELIKAFKKEKKDNNKQEIPPTK